MSEHVPDLRDFATRWLAAWNSHDTARVLALLHPECRWEDTVFWPHPITDRAEMTRYVDRIWEVMPDVVFDPGMPSVPPGPRS